MDEESNPVKEYLFEYIRGSQTIPELIEGKRFDEVIDEVTRNCYDKAASIGSKDESLSVLATGLLHYLLTNAYLNSQRKVEHKEMYLDIVVPDVKTLEKDPKRTLIIYIAKSSNPEIIMEEISNLEKVQPEKENIWAVLTENADVGKKSFVLSKERSSFSSIIFEIAQFSNIGGANKFKILRV